MLNINKLTKTKPKPKPNAYLSSYVCACRCEITLQLSGRPFYDICATGFRYLCPNYKPNLRDAPTMTSGSYVDICRMGARS